MSRVGFGVGVVLAARRPKHVEHCLILSYFKLGSTVNELDSHSRLSAHRNSVD